MLSFEQVAKKLGVDFTKPKNGAGWKKECREVFERERETVQDWFVRVYHFLPANFSFDDIEKCRIKISEIDLLTTDTQSSCHEDAVFPLPSHSHESHAESTWYRPSASNRFHSLVRI